MNTNQYDESNDISIDLEFGLMIKDRFIITENSISYNNTIYPLTSITRLRWGVFAHYTNGIKDRTSYGIWFGTTDKLVNIECSLRLELNKTSLDRYTTIIDHLWRAVGIRIMLNMLSSLSNNKMISFGGNRSLLKEKIPFKSRKPLIVDKDGITLHRHNIIASSEPVHCKWEELTYSGAAGYLKVESKNDKKVYGQLSYRDDDNTNILESMLQFLFKDGNNIKLRRGELII